MTVRRYYQACMSQNVNWLKWALTKPSASMRPIHLAIIKLAIRRKGG